MSQCQKKICATFYWIPWFTKNWVGDGNEATVYRLDGEEFSGIVMRVLSDGSAVELECLDEQLLGTTFLTPVDYGYQGTCLAPSFLQGEGVSFHPLLPGQSLGAMFKYKTAKLESETAARREIQAMLEDIPYAQYLGLLRDVRYLTTIGRSIEPQGDNLMASPGTLRWVDINHDPHKNFLGNVKAMITSHNNGGTGSLNRSIEDKLDTAAAEVGLPVDQAQAIKFIDQLKAEGNFNFRKAQKIPTIPPVALSSSPQNLVRTLHQVCRHVNYVPCPG